MSYQKSMGNLLGSIAFLIMMTVFFVIFFFSDVSVFASVLAGGFILGGIGAVIISIRELVLIHTIMKNGKRITTKICEHLDDMTEFHNGVSCLKLVLKYYDDFYLIVQREVDTGISKNKSSAYPIGYTVDILEYKEKFVLLPDTIRDEYIPGEEKFFEKQVYEPEIININCPNCNTVLEVETGKAVKCPFCHILVAVDEYGNLKS